MLAAGLIAAPMPWLTSPSRALGDRLVNIWLGTGLSAILLLAALQGVPAEVQEAAAIDGAGALRRFRHVTLPAIRPVLLVVVMLKLIGSFKTFDQVFIMTGGGPLHRTRHDPDLPLSAGLRALRFRLCLGDRHRVPAHGLRTQRVAGVCSCGSGA